MDDLSVTQDPQDAQLEGHPRQNICLNCGKQYLKPHHLTTHQSRSCRSTKRSLSELLKETKEFWESRKRRRSEAQQSTTSTRFDTNEEELNVTPALPKTSNTLIPTGSPCPTSAASSSQSDLTSTSDLDVAVANRKGKREKRLPRRYREDDLPEAPPRPRRAAGAADTSNHTTGTLAPAVAPVVVLAAHQALRTLESYTSRVDKFGIQRVYTAAAPPTHDPDAVIYVKVSANARKVATAGAGQTFGPFSSRSALDLAQWYWSSTSKSFLDFQKLIDIFKNPSFSLEDTVNVNWKSAFKALGSNASDLSEDFGAWIQDDGWTTTPISIDVPFHNRLKDPGVKRHHVCDLRHRRILSVIKEKLGNSMDSNQFHYYPFKSTWKRTVESQDVELYGELYSSRAFREVHKEIQRQPSTLRNNGLERVVVALMFWSDATQLTSFGSAALWPCYLFFGNESKNRRCRPSEHLGQHIAYFNKLPDTFTDYLKERNQGKVPTDALWAHCARELFHEQWSALLDPELVDAMHNGVVIACPDNQLRCFYPRIFTVLICGVRNNGTRPCHRCLVVKGDMGKLGALTDTERLEGTRCVNQKVSAVAQARKDIEAGYAVDGTKVEDVLKPLSLVPAQCAFSKGLSGLSFDIKDSLVVDVLHEFEVGVWKRLYVHLLRLLEAFASHQGSTLTAELDLRYRLTPAFGRDSIRKFGTNASEMKRRAARDFEDLLQCSIPAFEALFPEPHNEVVLKLLFICAQWHALAKLRLHHDLTLKLLEHTTTLLGAQIRLFYRDTCRKVQTKELRREAEARARREVKTADGTASSSRKPATLNIFTIKFHFLGDYPSVIRRFGTTDSYSTETGELYHRTPKSWYPRTDKKDYHKQLSQIERRQAQLLQILSQVDGRLQRQPNVPVSGRPQPCMDQQYDIGLSQNLPIALQYFSDTLGMRSLESYFLDFHVKLKRHLMPRIFETLGFPAERLSSLNESESWLRVIFEHDRLYSHKILRMNYATYDIRREQDVIHIDTPQCNIMVLNGRLTEKTCQQKHPYLYGRVLGVFHAKVAYVGPLPEGSNFDRSEAATFRRIDFVWVHWYDYLGAKDSFSLDRLSLSRLDSPVALDFIDPQDILRGIHLIPQFSLGKSTAPLPCFRFSRNPQDLWRVYFINKFADRDLFMRYQYGMSVGHLYMHAPNFPPPSTPSLAADFDHVLEIEPEPPIDDTVDDVEGEGETTEKANDPFDDMDDREVLTYDEMYDITAGIT